MTSWLQLSGTHGCNMMCLPAWHWCTVERPLRHRSSAAGCSPVAVYGTQACGSILFSGLAAPCARRGKQKLVCCRSAAYVLLLVLLLLLLWRGEHHCQHVKDNKPLLLHWGQLQQQQQQQQL